MQMSLFAGRRSSDRAFLLLQNLLCARHLPHYGGTSSVYAVTLIDRTLRQLGISDAQQRIPYTGKLSCLSFVKLEMACSNQQATWHLPSYKRRLIAALASSWVL